MRLEAELHRALADVARHVPRPFQVGIDLQSRGDQAQVARRRLVQRQQAQAHLVDLDVHAVDDVVALDDPLRLHCIAIHQGPHGVVDLLLDEPTHLQHAPAQLAKLVFVVTIDVWFRLHEQLPPSAPPLSRICP